MSATRFTLLAVVLSCAGAISVYGQGSGQGQSSPNGQGQNQGQNQGQGQNQTPGQPQAQSQGQSQTPGQTQGQAQGNQVSPASQDSHAGIVAIYDLTGTLDVVGGTGLEHPYLLLDVNGTTYSIKAAPYQFLERMGVLNLDGLIVTVTVAECRQGSLLALKITYNGAEYVFRDPTGKPVWGRRPVTPSSVNGSGGAVVDATSVTTLTVVVEKIATSLVSNQVRALVRTQNQQLAWVTLGPLSLILGQGFELEAGNQVRMMLAVQTRNREWVALQLQNPETGEMAMIRDMAGYEYGLK